MQIVAVLAGLLVIAVILRALAARAETVGAASPSHAAATLTEDSVRALLLRGRKIEAIKAYRRLHGVDLKNAKQAVDRLAEQLAPRR